MMVFGYDCVSCQFSGVAFVSLTSASVLNL